MAALPLVRRSIVITEEHMFGQPIRHAYCQEHQPEETRDLPTGQRVERFDTSDLAYFVTKEFRVVTEDDPFVICYCHSCHEFIIPRGEFMPPYGTLRGDRRHA